MAHQPKSSLSRHPGTAAHNTPVGRRQCGVSHTTYLYKAYHIFWLDRDHAPVERGFFGRVERTPPVCRSAVCAPFLSPSVSRVSQYSTLHRYSPGTGQAPSDGEGRTLQPSTIACPAAVPLEPPQWLYPPPCGGACPAPATGARRRRCWGGCGRRGGTKSAVNFLSARMRPRS